MNIAIIGAAYSGFQAAKYLKRLGHTITVTTTSEARVDELSKHADKVIVMFGSDKDKMPQLLEGQDIVLMTVAGGMVERDGKMVMDADLYHDAYFGTAQALVTALDDASSVKQVIFTSSLNTYGATDGSALVTEETPPKPAGPFQEVYVETEQLLLSAQSESRDILIYRTGSIYGPAREILSQAKQLTAQPVPFDGESDAMYIHRDDVVAGLVFAIDNKLSGIYNLFNDTLCSKKSFFEKVCDQHDLGEVNWLGVIPGPKNVSNQKLKDSGYEYLDPDSSRDTADLLLG